MTTLKQIEANRRNATKSTGPKSEEGKAVVACNAMKHGILSGCVYIEDSERSLYNEFCATMVCTLQPRGGFENFLVERIISTAWRLRRVICIETLMLKKTKESFCHKSYCEAFEGDSATDMATLSRYERSLENALYRALKELKAFQEREDVEILGTIVHG